MTTDWFQDDQARAVVLEAMMKSAERRIRHAMALMRGPGGCESPIEAELFGALYLQEGQSIAGDALQIVPCGTERWENVVAGLSHAAVDSRRGLRPIAALFPQMIIGPYRADMVLLISMGASSVAGLVIECDGHDYHLSSREKVSQDRARDREMQAMGFVVLRFTGSDIRRDVMGCVDQILDAGTEHAWKFRQGIPVATAARFLSPDLLLAAGKRYRVDGYKLLGPSDDRTAGAA